MYSTSNNFLTTIEVKTNDKYKWKEEYLSYDKLRKDVGVTYNAITSNRNDPNQKTVVCKYNTESQMKDHLELMQQVKQENFDKFNILCDVEGMQFNHWNILCERTNDIRKSSINHSNDVFFIANHSVQDKERWINSMKNQQDSGCNYDIRWWALMQNMNNPNEMSCMYRIPADRFE
jgi:hypothetical protein